MDNEKKNEQKPESAEGTPPEPADEVDKETSLEPKPTSDMREWAMRDVVNQIPSSVWKQMRRTQEILDSKPFLMSDEWKNYVSVPQWFDDATIQNMRRNEEMMDAAARLSTMHFRPVMSMLDSMKAAFTQVASAHLPDETGLEQMVKALQSVQLPDINWHAVSQAAQQQAILERDAYIEKLEQNPYFKPNLNTLSMELITLPSTLSHEVLDLLTHETLPVEMVKERIGVFDVSLLKKELEEEAHEAYLFRGYVDELLVGYGDNPDRYRTLIPGMFLILEGTLSETFRISQRGTAQEIKRKMRLFSDLFLAAYSRKPVDKSDSFYLQLLLANVKTVFEELTSSANPGDGVKINRNRVLHGRSDPADWQESDFLTLAHLLETTLYIKRIMDVLMLEFEEILTTEDIRISFVDYREPLLRDIASMKKGQKRTLTVGKAEAKMTAALRKDLEAIFGKESETLHLVLERGEVTSVASIAVASYREERHAGNKQ